VLHAICDCDIENVFTWKGNIWQCLQPGRADAVLLEILTVLPEEVIRLDSQVVFISSIIVISTV